MPPDGKAPEIAHAEVSGVELPAGEQSAGFRSRIRRWHRRRYVKGAFIWTHRWSSLAIGLVLLVVTTSGVPLLYQQEVSRAQHADAYNTAGGPATLSLAESLARRGRGRQVAIVAATVELIGVLLVGTAEQLSSTAWPDETVWSGYGAGYGWAPLVLPVAALAVLARHAPARSPLACESPSP